MSQFIAIYEAWIYLFWYLYRHYKKTSTTKSYTQDEKNNSIKIITLTNVALLQIGL